MKNWYLIHTKSKQESVAKMNLERQGFSTYLPMTIIRRKRCGKSVRNVEAMFPRYLFIQLSEQMDNWAPIRSTIGVSSLVRFGNTPTKIPQKLINALIAKEGEDGIHELPVKNFVTGEKIVISEGPFEGYEALFACEEANERVSLLLKIAENTIKIKLKKDLIEPLS